MRHGELGSLPMGGWLVGLTRKYAQKPGRPGNPGPDECTRAIIPPDPPMSSFETKSFPNDCANIGDTHGRCQRPEATAWAKVCKVMLCELYHTKSGG